MCPNDTIVADLHQIVELYSRLNDGISYRGPVNTRIGANLYGITNAHTAHLWDLPIGTIGERIKAKAICADDGATVDNDAPSKVYPRIEADIGIQGAVIANLTRFTDIGAWIHCHTVPEPYPSTNYDIGADVYTYSQGHLRRKHGSGIDAPGGRGLRWEKVLQKLDEAEIRIGDTDGRTINRDVGCDQHRCGT
jgi:hypothetical protein